MPCPLQLQHWTLDTVDNDIADDFNALSTAGMPYRLSLPCRQPSRVMMSCRNQCWWSAEHRDADLRRYCQLTSDICSSLSVDSCMRCHAHPTLLRVTSFLSDYSVVKNSPLQMFRAGSMLSDSCRADVSLFCYCWVARLSKWQANVLTPIE